MAAETDLDRAKGQPRTATTRRNEWGCTRVGLAHLQEKSPCFPVDWESLLMRCSV